MNQIQNILDKIEREKEVQKQSKALVEQYMIDLQKHNPFKVGGTATNDRGFDFDVTHTWVSDDEYAHGLVFVAMGGHINSDFITCKDAVNEYK